MSYEFPPFLKQLVDNHMSSGLYGSEDELLAAALESLVLDDEEVAAIQKGLDSYRAGSSGVPVDDAFERLRKMYGIPTEP